MEVKLKASLMIDGKIKSTIHLKRLESEDDKVFLYHGSDIFMNQLFGETADKDKSVKVVVFNDGKELHSTTLTKGVLGFGLESFSNVSSDTHSFCVWNDLVNVRRDKHDNEYTYNWRCRLLFNDVKAAI